MKRSSHADPARRAVTRAVRAALAPHRRVVLAVSGGLDSAVLLDAVVAAGLRHRVAAVATFDHGSGTPAARAAAFVARAAARLGMPCVVGRVTGREAAVAEPGEATWRAARWTFLRDVAAAVNAVVVTAHTRDDQLETVAMRILRQAGPRGLAGLDTDGPVVRPLLTLPRSTVAAYARTAHVSHVTDPTNRSHRFLRNRLRLDLLPALRAAAPSFDLWLLDLGTRAATWRRNVERVAAAVPLARDTAGRVVIASDPLLTYSSGELATLWPALAARAGVTLDRRGTDRLARSTLGARVGARIQLSGGVEVVRVHDGFAFGTLARAGDDAVRPLDRAVTVGRWHFSQRPADGGDDRWTASFAAGTALTVRAWRAGDRMCGPGAATPRRVARFFADAGIVGADRHGWPVVLVDDEIVWIPGVCRSDAASVRSGWPAVGWGCERRDC